MDEVQREALRRSRVFLVTNLMPNTLWDHLVEKGVFTDMMLEYIKCKTPRSEQVRTLLSDLNRRHRAAYSAFLECLEETGHQHCAQHIRLHEMKYRVEKGLAPVMQETSSTASSEQALSGMIVGQTAQVVTTSPPSQPVDADEDVEMLLQDNPQSSTSQSSSSELPSIALHGYSYHRSSTTDEVYNMDSTPRGHVFIINNCKFVYLAERKGTHRDAQNVKTMFEELGFEVNILHDLTAEMMIARLKEFAKTCPWSQVDSCVVVILTHGSDAQRMYGTDGNFDNCNFITNRDLFDIYGSSNCPGLQGKPKFFLIQACRGSEEDLGCVSLSSTRHSIQETNEKDITGEQGDAFPEIDRPDGRSLGLLSLPSFSDMIIAQSSVAGFVSYRNTEHGSYFISSVVEVFRNCADKCDINDMLTKVNRKIAEDFQTEDGKKMMPASTNQLLKKWFLNPQIRQAQR
ncbi:caspase-6-like [Haliotis cracherodii]|uniref:caspase-6-like n=1 Tax=Haliotis cracherodii TaxID=6455 RepID=UPI0039E8CE15